MKLMVTEEEKLLKQRIRHLLDEKKTSIRTLADTESERVMLGRQINGDDTIVSYRTIQKLLYMFHDIDANWLVMGEGSMYKTDHLAPRVYTQHNEVKGNNAGGDINVGPDTIVTKKTVDTLQARVAELENDKKYLQLVIDSMTDGIQRK